MKTLIVNQNETIKISPEFFDPNGFQELLDIEAADLTLEQAQTISKNLGPSQNERLSIAEDASVEEVFRKAIEEVKTDEDLGKHIRKATSAHHKEHENHFTSAIAAEYDKKIHEASLQKFRVRKEVQNGQVTYFVNEEEVLVFNEGFSGAKPIDFLMAAGQLIWDSLALIGVGVGIELPERRGGFIEFIRGIQNKIRRFVGLLGRIAQHAEEPIRQVKKILDAWQKVNLGQDIFKFVFGDLSWWERAWMVVKFVATIALACVSAGTSLLHKLVKAGALIISIVGDVQDVIESLKSQSVPA